MIKGFTVEPISTNHPSHRVRLDHSSKSRPSHMVAALLDANSGLPFRVTWKGSKVPRGGVFCDHVIAGMQHGRILDKNGAMIGTYTRKHTFAGDDGDEHEVEAWSVPLRLEPGLGGDTAGADAPRTPLNAEDVCAVPMTWEPAKDEETP